MMVSAFVAHCREETARCLQNRSSSPTRSAAPPAKTTTTTKLWDTEIRGFVLHVGKRSRAFYFQRDVAGKTKRIRIGPYPEVSAAAARATAQEFALQFARGAGKAAMRRVPTLQEATDTYLSRPKLRSEENKKNVRFQMTRHRGDWLRLPLAQIDRTMVVTRHGKMRATPTTANHTFQSFRSIWNHARRTHDLNECPTLAIEWYLEQPAAAIIDDLPRWHQEVSALKNPIHRAYYRLLLTTGLRKAEAAALTWADVHDDHVHLPITKNGRPFSLPLVEEHHAILAPVRGLDRTWVFLAWRSETGHIVTPERISYSPHAHRRTFATIATTDAGLFEETVGRLLNHTPQTVTGSRYVVVDHERLRPPTDQVMGAFK